MRIISGNICKECCYCLEEDYDNYGQCCRDNMYTTVNLNQRACRFFCNDEETFNYYTQPNQDDSDIDDYE